MSGDFENIMTRTWDEIPEPSLYPTGTWRLRIVSSFKGEDDNGHDTFTFYFVGVEALNDVDPGELAEAQEGLDGVRVQNRFVIESVADLDKMRKFLTMAGVDTRGLTPEESAKEAKGHELLGYIRTKSYQSKKTGKTETINTVAQFAPVDQEALAA